MGSEVQDKEREDTLMQVSLQVVIYNLVYRIIYMYISVLWRLMQRIQGSFISKEEN